MSQDYQITCDHKIQKITFQAMASPCEFLLYSQDKSLAQWAARKGIAEVRRFEAKFSRYIKGNLCWQINHSQGNPVLIDRETKTLLDYGKSIYQLSDGEFDLTAGILSKIWRFQPGEVPPTSTQVNEMLAHIGFNRIKYDETEMTMPSNMGLDFGGIGKEYCVDQLVKLLAEKCQPLSVSFMVNLGGDLSAVNYNSEDPPWVVGLEGVESGNNLPAVIKLSQGAVATSGSTKRGFEYQGKHYAHIMNAKTGYPVQGAPRSISVFASSCSLAGSMSTLAHIQGDKAEKFLADCGIKSICCW